MTQKNTIPELSKLIEHARNIVFEARRQGTLDSLSVNGVKKQLELHWFLDEGTLSTGQYKKPIGDAVRSATTDEIPVIDNTRSETRVEKIKDQKVDKQPYEGKPTSSTSIQTKTTDVPVPPPVAESSRSAPAVVKKVAKMPKPEDRGRRDFVLNTTKTAAKINKTPRSNPITTLKRPFRSREYIEDDDEDDSAITDSSGKGDRPSSQGSSSESEELERDRKRKKRTAIEEVTERPKGDSDPQNAEQDETAIKKLKAYVGACGVRKKWAKEFQNCPEPNQQIRRLKKILADLGMEGKYSMEKAKQIKKKRDLERELGMLSEDVIDFERKAGVSRTRRKKSGRPVGELDTETESEVGNDGSDSDGERRQSASAVIKKYLRRQRVGDSDGE